ncbi:MULTISPECIES: hypothetical protein [Dehalococcoides]|jgi:hypothetical protein|uniref:Uncharacterized protein n=2 Tax=Dehalococcoides mccartyi TaxID=61435 RepID=A0A142VB92_9CHLR|nr:MULTISPECIES: hypothetical protein [Dehalococcoides]AGG06894.1 hypothetical protein dcmb_1296 [Dehalococcoides mccartyi DCMB5]AGG08389.1 hypothetical protein btf_1315 [Dehalococcoides mccartyi BTF08]AII61392.1 hypothetical protein X794_06180 [Dehalococcoides mccartyi CG5]AMU87094.1 hypothetical protein Dm11a5_1268 [Dehalococcoides mccartyi]AOV99880.1 hypothetical protein DCWBC2_1259 [Dehalococcoides mccartyi]
MKLERKHGIGIMALSCLILTGAVLIFISVPDWGNFIGSYFQGVNPDEYSPQVAPLLSTWKSLFSPLLAQVGGYMKAAGIFGGCALSIMGLIAMFVGINIVRQSAKSI